MRGAPKGDDEELVKALKAIADPTRFRIVQKVGAAGELSCGAIGKHFDVSQPTISHHLKVLVDAGVLVSRADGKHHYIAVDHALLARLSRLFTDRLAAPRRRRSG